MSHPDRDVYLVVIKGKSIAELVQDHHPEANNNLHEFSIPTPLEKMHQGWRLVN